MQGYSDIDTWPPFSQGIGRQWSLEAVHSQGHSPKNIRSVSCLSVTWVQKHLRCSVYSLGTTSKCAALTDGFGVYCGKAGGLACGFVLSGFHGQQECPQKEKN